MSSEKAGAKNVVIVADSIGRYDLSGVLRGHALTDREEEWDRVRDPRLQLEDGVA